MIARREFRHGMNLTDHTAKAYRTGFNTMWKHAGAYMARKGIKKAGEYDPKNVHGGRLYGSRKECLITDKIAGNIIERIYESGKVGLDQLKQVRHSLSYAHYLQTGQQGENFTEVYAQWKTFNLKSLPAVRKPKKPKRIPTPENLKEAFTKPWTPQHPWCLATFTTGLLSAWDTDVFGLRPNVDVKKVKDSIVHDINPNERYGWTDMKGGRSKLHGQKRGTRPWKVFRVCCCKDQHTSPPEVLILNAEGNPPEPPNWNTVCPLAAMELMKAVQGETFKIYVKWFPSTQQFGQNFGDPPSHGNNWLMSQGLPGPFDRSSGRKSLSRWLQHLSVPYRESLHIHGDLECVWRGHYESKLLKSGLKTRGQSEDPDTATAGLKRFAAWLHKDGQPPPSLKQRLKNILDSLE